MGHACNLNIRTNSNPWICCICYYILMNIFDIRSGKHLESKLILIQSLDEEEWIKLIYIEYISYNFFTTIRPHVCGSWTLPNKKTLKK
jgi:hypothetical protein